MFGDVFCPQIQSNGVLAGGYKAPGEHVLRQQK